jgi:hypothetical protein
MRLCILGPDASPCIHRVSLCIASTVFPKLKHFTILTSCCNQRIYVITHFYTSYVYVMYYFVIITSVMMPRDDPDETNRPYLRAGCHRMATY